MGKVGEYEAHATECRRLAAQIKKSKAKKAIGRVAEVWDRLARQRRQGIVEDNPEQT